MSESARKSEQGSYDPSVPRILISRRALEPIGTFVHEFAHFLDNRILHPLPNEYASRYDIDMADFVSLCWESTPVMEARKILGRYSRRLPAADRVFLREFLEPHEIFARAYMQWICSKSDNAKVKNALTRRIAETFTFFDRTFMPLWESAEFDDIMKTLVDLFEKKGLL